MMEAVMPFLYEDGRAWWGDREVAIEKREKMESLWPRVVILRDFAGRRLSQIGSGKTAREAWDEARSYARFYSWRLANPEKLDALCLFWRGAIDRECLEFLMRDRVIGLGDGGR